jgi:hypothetical protein
MIPDVVPAQALETAIDKIIDSGDKLGIVAILLIVLAVLIYGLMSGKVDSPANVARERAECARLKKALEASVAEITESRVNYAVAAERMETLKTEAEALRVRVKDLEQRVFGEMTQRQADA